MLERLENEHDDLEFSQDHQAQVASHEVDDANPQMRVWCSHFVQKSSDVDDVRINATADEI